MYLRIIIVYAKENKSHKELHFVLYIRKKERKIVKLYVENRNPQIVFSLLTYNTPTPPSQTKQGKEKKVYQPYIPSFFLSLSSSHCLLIWAEIKSVYVRICHIKKKCFFFFSFSYVLTYNYSKSKARTLQLVGARPAGLVVGWLTI